MANDEALVLRAQQGDTSAFEELVNKYGEYVYNLALRVIRHPDEANDLAQEAFLRAWRGLPNFQRAAQFHTWLYRIVVNLCYNHQPRLQRELTQIVPDAELEHLADQRQVVETTVLSAELADILYQAIDELPDHYRLLVTLRHLQEMSYNEIAETTRLPLGTVKTGIYRARNRLRAVLAEYESGVVDERR